MAGNFTQIGIEAVIDGLADFNRGLLSMENSMDNTNTAVEDLSNTVNELLDDQLAAMEEQTKLLGRIVNNTLNPAVNDLDEEMGEAKSSGKKFGATLLDIVNTAANVANAIANVTRFVVDLGVKLARIAIDSVKFFADKLIDLGKASFTAAVDFSSAFTGVLKTTDGLVDEFGNLTELGEEVKQGIRDLALEIPTSADALAGLGETAGQLGIEEENIVDFIATVAKLGETTNVVGEEGATAIAQFFTVMGTGQDQFENFASAIVDLGNSFPTSEAQILSFAQRIAGAASIAGLTEADVLGIGTAFSAVGVEAEAGGTAIQKVLLGINSAVLTGGDQLDIFAGTAGFTSEEFAAFWEKDAGGAFTDFVGGLTAAGDEAIFILEALGLTDQRLTRAFLSVANAEGLLEETITDASAAWEENTALQKEADLRFQTIESRIELAKNALKDMGITIGEALFPAFESLLPIFNDLLQQAQPFVEQLGMWLSENLPIAIQTLATFWETTLLPAIQTAWEFITSSVVPVLAELWTWLQENVPIAIQTLVGFWENTLLPALQTAGAFIEENVIPAFNAIVNWLIEEGPGALETLKGVWDEVWGFIQENAGTFIAWFEENLPLIIETAQTLVAFWQNTSVDLSATWEIIKAAFAIFLDGLLQVITLVMQVITGDWAGAWETIKELASTIWENIKTTFTFFLEGIGGILSTVWENIKTIWQTNWELFVEIAAVVWENIKTSIGEFLTGIGEFITTKVTEIKDTWQGILNNIKEIASTVWENIKEAILEKLRALFESMGLNFDEMVERWSAIWADILLIFQTLWQQISEAIAIKMEEIILFLTEKWNAISLKVTEIWTAISTFISEKVLEIFTFITTKIQELIDWWTPIWNRFSAAITFVWNAIIEIVTEKVQELFDLITEKVTKIIEWIDEKKDDIKETGKGIIQGLIDGVKEVAGKLISAVTGAVEDAIGAAKSLLGIDSPSKVFEGIGINIGEGLAIGIESISPTVQASIGNLVMPSMAMAAGPTMQGSSVIQNTMNNTFNMPISGQMSQARAQGGILNTVTGAFRNQT